MNLKMNKDKLKETIKITTIHFKVKNNILDLRETEHNYGAHELYWHHAIFKKVDKFIRKHIQRGTPEVKIITGRSLVMKKLVNKTLDDYELYSLENISNSDKLIINLT